MITNIFLSAMAIAGFAIIWRNWLEDHKNFKTWIISTFDFFQLHKIVTCGSCFTYWLALIGTLVLKPLVLWTPSVPLINLFLQWMALAWLSVTLRFAYVALQELVSYQVHKMKTSDHQHNSNCQINEVPT